MYIQNISNSSWKSEKIESSTLVRICLAIITHIMATNLGLSYVFPYWPFFYNFLFSLSSESGNTPPSTEASIGMFVEIFDILYDSFHNAYFWETQKYCLDRKTSFI